MKVFYDESFTQVYTVDPAAAAGRMEAVLQVIEGRGSLLTPPKATRGQIRLAHTHSHIEYVADKGLYEISALAAGGAIAAARTGLQEPAFGLVRPPGHHASADSSWGFCYFNNMAVAILTLWEEDLIDRALILDIDLHFGDGTVNLLGPKDWVEIHNPSGRNPDEYMAEVERALSGVQVSLIGISAGFDYHRDDWGGLLRTEDYCVIGRQAREAARACGAGCFGILEGGYNHRVLGYNVAALLDGLSL